MRLAGLGGVFNADAVALQAATLFPDEVDFNNRNKNSTK